MITPSNSQLLALLDPVSSGREFELRSTSLDEIRMAMAIAQPVDEGFSVEDLALAVISGVAQTLRLSFPDNDYSGAYATALFEWTISRNGYESELETTQILELLNDIDSSTTTSQDRFPHRVDSQAVETLVKSLVKSEVHRWRGTGTRAYVVSALTGLDPPEHDQVVALGDTVDLVLEEMGIWTHTPARYTNPNLDDRAPPIEIHDLDYELLLKADLVVALMDWPTTGGGQELAWLQDTGGVLVVVARETTKVSRLVLGTPVATRRIDSSELPEALKATVEGLSAQIRSRTERRARIKAEYASRANLLRRELDACDQWPFAREIPERLIRQTLKSAHHLANAPTWLVDMIESEIGPGTTAQRLLQGEEVASLARYVRKNGHSITRMERLYTAAISRQDGADKNRADFRHEKSWENLDRSLR